MSTRFWCHGRQNTTFEVLVRTWVSSDSFFDVRSQFFISLPQNFLTSNICLKVDGNYFSQLYCQILRVQFFVTLEFPGSCVLVPHFSLLSIDFRFYGLLNWSLSTSPSSKSTAMSVHDFQCYVSLSGELHLEMNSLLLKIVYTFRRNFYCHAKKCCLNIRCYFYLKPG